MIASVKEDKLARAMADKLIEFDECFGSSHVFSGNVRKAGVGSMSRKAKAKRRTGSIGSRGNQYALLKKLYRLVLNDKRFLNSGGAREGKLHQRQLRELLKVVRLAFKMAYGEDYRSYRQRAVTWAAVLHEAWDDSISPSGIEVFILRRGGIQSLYGIWKATREKS